jgi:two-component system nitrate/nitrite response regulator NarL
MATATHPDTTTVVIAEDHPMFRDALRSTFDKDPAFMVVAVAHDGVELQRLWAEHRPTLAVTDLSMGGVGGIDAAKAICGEHPDARIVALSAHTDPQMVTAAVEAGMCGYLSKSLPAHEMLRHLRSAAGGGVAFDDWSTNVLVENTRNPQETNPCGLTERHVAVMRGIADGLSRDEIAAELCISVSSVKDATGELYRKLGVCNAASAVRRSIELGVITAKRVNL